MKPSRHAGISEKKLSLNKETLQRLKIGKTGIKTGLMCPTLECTRPEVCTSRNSDFSLCPVCDDTLVLR